MSSTFGINYSTRVMSYGVGPPAAPADRAKHEQAAAVDLTSPRSSPAKAYVASSRALVKSTAAACSCFARSAGAAGGPTP